MSDRSASSIAKDIYISQKFKSFISEPEGCSFVAALEEQYQCVISVINDMLTITSKRATPVDTAQIENILRDKWHKRDIQTMIRVAALNASCTHICQMILPRAYSAVVILFAADVRRRSKCSDIVIEHSDGKVDIFGNESNVSAAREIVIEVLTDHFGMLEIEVPYPRRTTRMSHSPLSPTFPSIMETEITSAQHQKKFDRVTGEHGINAILSSTPSAPVSSLPVSSCLDDVHSYLASFDSPMRFSMNETNIGPFARPNIFSPPPIAANFNFSPAKSSPTPQTTRINNVEKIRVWIPKDNVGRILGNRANVKKQIEGQFNCVITVRTDCVAQFGMTAVDVMGQNAEQCQNARDAILAVHTTHNETLPTNPDSGFSSPVSSLQDVASANNTTPDKRFIRRSNFRDQPKVLLALTPRKTPPMEE